ncbi:hypothetical protein L218DRAFT_375211 [Marasmius fiardii PR-910]|nr:hypothetical protein L218DRAFT_375211 [Marasmius fiardii PR-910]
MSITSFPPELLEQLLLLLDPLDVSALSQTSRLFHTLVYHPPDQHLWRNLYLAQGLDDPTLCFSPLGHRFLGSPESRAQSFNWKKELQEVIFARTVVEKGPAKWGREDRKRALKTLLKLITYVPPLELREEDMNSDKMSSNLMWVAAECRKGALVDPDFQGEDGGEVEGAGEKEQEDEEELQLRAKLHTHLGLTPNDWSEEALLESTMFVYTMANYHWGNEFGPFREHPGNDNVALRVNWVHIHHIHRTISMKLLEGVSAEAKENIRQLDVFIYQLSFPHTQLVLPRREVEEGISKDWAGVEGKWDISFCFCDHGDLIRFNHAQRQRRFVIPTAADLIQVLRTMPATFKITRTVDDPKFPGRPVIYFGGQLDLGGGGSQSIMSGIVKVMDDEEGNDVVRWNFVSGETGNPVWSGEGVQIGGIRSAYGILGTWTTIFHDDDDPVGPFWLRKRND